jgi:hypothetical protein
VRRLCTRARHLAAERSAEQLEEPCRLVTHIHVVELPVEGMRIDPVARAGDLDREAAPLTRRLLRRLHERARDAAPARSAVDDKTHDPRPPAGSLQIRDPVEREASDYLLVAFGNQDAASRVIQPLADPLRYFVGSSGMT